MVGFGASRVVVGLAASGLGVVVVGFGASATAEVEDGFGAGAWELGFVSTTLTGAELEATTTGGSSLGGASTTGVVAEAGTVTVFTAIGLPVVSAPSGPRETGIH